MKRSLLQHEKHNILPEYGKKRLILYADTLQEIAGSFEEETAPDGGEEGVRLYLLQKKQEQNCLFADQLSQTADALKALANETYATSGLLSRLKRRIEKGLVDNSLIVEELYVVEVEEHLEIGMQIRAKEDEMFYTEELMEYLSELCHRRLKSQESNPTYVHDETRLLVFEEEVNYYILDGIARAKKENEDDSGDSYLIREYARGMQLIALSDGMGSGSLAASDSERLLDLLDKFMETGFHVDKAGALLNSLICMNAQEEHTVSLDTCEVDLYQGTCRFLKYGAVPSFIKRGQRIFCVTGESLPLGIFYRNDPDDRAYGLEDGDYLIMMTDGVLDAFLSDCAPDGNMEAVREFLTGLSFENPRQMAIMIINAAIAKAGGRIHDDMTVVVFGIFANT